MRAVNYFSEIFKGDFNSSTRAPAPARPPLRPPATFCDMKMFSVLNIFSVKLCSVVGILGLEVLGMPDRVPVPGAGPVD